ncbi:MAG TPA: MBL fold metallo-hydrolase [Pirellulales bacterium]
MIHTQDNHVVDSDKTADSTSSSEHKSSRQNHFDQPLGAGRVRFPVARDVERLKLGIVNAYLLGEPNAGDREWVLVDAGMRFSNAQLVQAAAERFGPKSRPAAIVLTHGHFDHVGDLPALADRWDAPVFCHPLEMPYVTGRSSYPPPDPVAGGGMLSAFSRFFPSAPINLGQRVQSLPEDGSVPGLQQWRWLHTPGHTAGHVSLFRDFDRLLIAGDAFTTVAQESALAVMMQITAVNRPPAYYTSDWESARDSVEKLAELHPAIAATGHGVPMAARELMMQLHDLLEKWETVAVPKNARYSHKPAVTNENGVVSVPPPVTDGKLIAAAGLALGALVGAMLMGSRRS